MKILYESNFLKKIARDTIGFRFDQIDMITKENRLSDTKKDRLTDLSICVELAALALSTSNPNRWIDTISELTKECAIALKRDAEASEKND